jgi:hypothetical protein
LRAHQHAANSVEAEGACRLLGERVLGGVEAADMRTAHGYEFKVMAIDG